MNLNEMIENEIEHGYGDDNARSKVCQDIILKAISESSLSRNVTIKGGVVMRSKTGSVRRATQDLDMDFIKYSLGDTHIDEFINRLNCIDKLIIERTGEIEELKQQDYHGKRIYVIISDDEGTSIVSKLDLGVHNHLDIEQEEYCFDIALDDEGASLLINSNEQMFTEKLKSFLRFGPISTRYKDIYDMYYLSRHLDKSKLHDCLVSFIYDDSKMKEDDIDSVIRRVDSAFRSRTFIHRLESSDKRWLDEDVEEVTGGILEVLDNTKQSKQERHD